jgi:hypothetical protein
MREIERGDVPLPSESPYSSVLLTVFEGCHGYSAVRVVVRRYIARTGDRTTSQGCQCRTAISALVPSRACVPHPSRTQPHAVILISKRIPPIVSVVLQSSWFDIIFVAVSVYGSIPLVDWTILCTTPDSAWATSQITILH